MRLKQRIVRILIEEIVADVDEATTEIVLLIHWTGGRHSELRMKKNSLVNTAVAPASKRSRLFGEWLASFRMTRSPQL